MKLFDGLKWNNSFSSLQRAFALMMKSAVLNERLAMKVITQSQFSDKMLAEIPHMRAYSRMMTNDVSSADKHVFDTITQICRMRSSAMGSLQFRVQLFKILRHYLATAEPPPFGNSTTNRLTPPRMHRFLPSDTYPTKPLTLPAALRYLDFDARDAVVLIKGAGITPRNAALVSYCHESAINLRLRRGILLLNKLMQLEPATSASPVTSITIE